jgi:hypothetical protein
LLSRRSLTKTSLRADASRAGALEAWQHIGRALSTSPDTDDQRLAAGIARFIRDFEVSRSDRDTVRAVQRAPLLPGGAALDRDPGR